MRTTTRLGVAAVCVASSIVIGVSLSASATPKHAQVSPFANKPWFAANVPNTYTAPSDYVKPALPAITAGPDNPPGPNNGVIQNVSADPSQVAALLPSSLLGTISLATIYNAVVGNDYLNLESGADASDSTTGMLIVSWLNPSGASDANTAANGTFTLQGTGALTMTAVTSTTVTLSDASGTIYEFDLSTDTFA